MKLPEKRVYWGVHKEDIKYLYEIGIPEHKCNYYACVFVYICFDPFCNTSPWGFMPHNDNSIDYFEREKYEYLGEFISLKKERKKKLKKLNSL